MQHVDDYFEEEIVDFISDLDRTKITKDSYRKILMNFSLYLREKDIVKPKSRHIIEYKEVLEKKLSPLSIKKVVTVLRVFFHYLARNEIYHDISVGITFPNTTKVMKRDVLTLEDVSKILDIAKSESEGSLESFRNYVIVSLLATTGLRTIEVERSEVADLSMINNVHILYIRGKGRADKSEYVKLSEPVYQLIEQYLSKRRDNYPALFITHGHNSYGNPIQTRMIREIVKDYLIKADMTDKHISAHSLRHFVCSEILRSGGTLEEAQQVLRHRNISTTQIYNHSLKREENDSELVISGKLFPERRLH